MPKKTEEISAAQAKGIRTVPTHNLEPNPYNPRMLFDRAPMAILQDSIEKVGILVPLTVYRDSKKKKFVILDGQRRWTCARELGLKSVPVNEVHEPSLVENIVTMFQIHQLREPWELMPTALTLERLMKELQEKNEAKLAALTGLDRAVVVRCKKLLTFPRSYQDMMLEAEPSDRVKADFFIELYPVITDRDVTKFRWFKRGTFTDTMLERYQRGSPQLRSVTSFRQVKQNITLARKANQIPKLDKQLQRFYESEDVPIEDLAISEAGVVEERDRIIRQATQLEASISSIDAKDFFGEEELWRVLTRLMELIRRKLNQADRKAK